MKRVVLLLSIVFLTTFSSPPRAWSHCEIPCGIYDDEARIKQMDEDIATLEKSMNEIIKLGKAGEKNYNQIVRWVLNKEEHADRIRETVAQYFLAQRIKKPKGNKKKEQEHYFKQLSLLHEIIVAAMQSKQTVDLSQIKGLRSLVNEFWNNYQKR